MHDREVPCDTSHGARFFQRLETVKWPSRRAHHDGPGDKEEGGPEARLVGRGRNGCCLALQGGEVEVAELHSENVLVQQSRSKEGGQRARHGTQPRGEGHRLVHPDGGHTGRAWGQRIRCGDKSQDATHKCHTSEAPWTAQYPENPMRITAPA